MFSITNPKRRWRRPRKALTFLSETHLPETDISGVHFRANGIRPVDRDFTGVMSGATRKTLPISGLAYPTRWSVTTRRQPELTGHRPNEHRIGLSDALVVGRMCASKVFAILKKAARTYAAHEPDPNLLRRLATLCCSARRAHPNDFTLEDLAQQIAGGLA